MGQKKLKKNFDLTGKSGFVSDENDYGYKQHATSPVCS